MTGRDSQTVVEQIVAEIVHQNGHDMIVTQGAEFGADLQFDELDVVEVILACEEHFHVTLTDEDITTSSRVSDLVSLVTEALREKDQHDETWKNWPGPIAEQADAAKKATE